MASIFRIEFSLEDKGFLLKKKKNLTLTISTLQHRTKYWISEFNYELPFFPLKTNFLITG